MNYQLDEKKLFDEVLELIRRTSTDLCEDVEDALRDARGAESTGSVAESTLTEILDNVELARRNSTPICQDTGANIYYVSIPCGVSMRRVEEVICCATVEATNKAYLRPNAVDSVTGENSGDNTGVMAPQINFEEWDKHAIGIKLMLKGGGSENVSRQYTLPDKELGAGRDLDGVYKCVIDSVNRAQGLGCASGIIGVGIGGDRSTGMKWAKKQLFRAMGDENDVEELAELESRLGNDLNQLGIGPMGFGGRSTVLGVKVGALHRLPASFFVSVAYMCWANRRREILIPLEGE